MCGCGFLFAFYSNCGRGQIPQLGFKFCDPGRTVVPAYDTIIISRPTIIYITFPYTVHLVYIKATRFTLITPHPPWTRFPWLPIHFANCLWQFSDLLWNKLSFISLLHAWAISLHRYCYLLYTVDGWRQSMHVQLITVALIGQQHRHNGRIGPYMSASPPTACQCIMLASCSEWSSTSLV